MPDFLDLVRNEFERSRQIQKTRGAVIRPPDETTPHTFTGVVMEGLRRRFAARPPVTKELKLVDRATTFEDVIRSRSKGYHAVRNAADFPADFDEDGLGLADLDSLLGL